MRQASPSPSTVRRSVMPSDPHSLPVLAMDTRARRGRRPHRPVGPVLAMDTRARRGRRPHRPVGPVLAMDTRARQVPPGLGSA